MLTLFWDERGVILKHYMPRGNTVTSATYADLLKYHLPPAIKSKRRGLLVCSTWQCSAPYCPFSCYNNPRSVLRVSSTSAVPARPNPPVTSMSLDRSKMRWEASLSGPMKRCSRRCTSGGDLSQKNFFLEVSMHFRNAGTLVWNAMETT